jgi:hypothetical protein
MNLEGDCQEIEVTPHLESLATFGLSLERVCHELYTYKLIPNLEVTKNFLNKTPT